MNSSKIIVRMGPQQRTAELELTTPHDSPRSDWLEGALSQIGVRAIYTVELSTPRYRIVRSKLAERDGSTFNGTRIMEILRVAQEPRRDTDGYRRFAA